VFRLHVAGEPGVLYTRFLSSSEPKVLDAGRIGYRRGIPVLSHEIGQLSLMTIIVSSVKRVPHLSGYTILTTMRRFANMNAEISIPR